MNNNTNKSIAIIYKLPFVGFIALLISYFLVVAYYNTKICDDIIATDLVSKLGAVDYITYIYTMWEGSYSQGIISALIAPCWNNGSLFIYTIMLGAITVVSLYLFYSLLIKYYLPQFNNQITIFIIALLSFLSIFFSAPDVSSAGMVWFTGSYSYLLSVNFLLLGIFFIIQQQKWKVTLGALFILFFAGFRLNYTVYVLAITSILLAYNLLYLKNKRNYKTYLLIITILIIGLIIYFMAPGNAKRAVASGVALNAESVMYKLTHLEFWKAFISGLIYMIKIHLIKTTAVAVVIITPCFFILDTTPFNTSVIKKLFFQSAFFLVFILLLHVFLFTLIMNGPGPSRTYVFIYILKTITIFCALYWLFSLVNITKYSIIISAVYVALIGVFIYKLFFVDYHNMKTLHQQKKGRAIQIASSIKNNTDTLIFVPLTHCYYLPSEDNCLGFDPRVANKYIIIKQAK
ncbi:MAG: hypothetical protein H7331_03395 [Bacteroidia bacterium]|nr:hypothetical protein [Bacteroidia bacterium]